MLQRMLLMLLLLVSPAVLPAAEPPLGEVGVAPVKTQFLRIARDQRGRAMTLDTAIVRYHNDNGAIVDLIGAVHVGEESYYTRLNRQFKEYEVLLYELVAEKGAKPSDRKKQPADNPLAGLGSMQGAMTTILGLQHQLEGVDYTPDNFVHADLSPDQLKEKMAERGDSPMVLFLETMAQSMREDELRKRNPPFRNPEDDISDEELLMGLLQAFITGKGSPVLKRYMALQMGDMENQVKAFGGNLGKLIIDDRNEACFVVLDQQLANGKKKIGVFYGAAHLPDMEQRLQKRGFKRFGPGTGQVWLEAWELR